MRGIRRILFDGAAVELGAIPLASVSGNVVTSSAANFIGVSSLTAAAKWIAVGVAVGIGSGAAVTVGKIDVGSGVSVGGVSCATVAGPVGAAPSFSAAGSSGVSCSTVAGKVGTGMAVGNAATRGAVAASKIGFATAGGNIGTAASSTSSKIGVGSAYSLLAAQSSSAYSKIGYATAISAISAFNVTVTVGNVVIGAVWPDPSDVRAGTQYGPSGTDYTGTMLAHTYSRGRVVNA